MAANPNELRALTLLGQEIGRSVVPWPGKKALREILTRYPDVSGPEYSHFNDGWCIFSRASVGDEWHHIRPDGSFIEPQSSSMFRGWSDSCHHLCLVEVETTTKMDDFKLTRYGMIWDGFFGEMGAWDFHVIVWDWYDQWRELNLHRLYHRAFSECEPARSRHDALADAQLSRDDSRVSAIRTRLAAARYAPISSDC